MRAYGCGADAKASTGPLAPDLTRSTTFAAASAEELRAIGAGERSGEFYPRYGHPAARDFESRVAAMEGAEGAVCFASGMAALHAVFCGLLSKGDLLAASRDLYGGTSALLDRDLPRFGIEVVRFDPFDPEERRSVLDRARLIHVETPTNPTCRIVDLAAFAERTDALLCVDATFAPPPLQRSLEKGADLVMHSATKFLGGHSDALGGVIASRHELLEPIELFRRRSGGVLAPETAWLLARSLRTLELRVLRATENAERLARFLEEKVERVFYPGLESHPDHALARGQMKGFGAMLAFEVKGGLRGAIEFYDRLSVIARAVSLGGVESVASLPIHTSHAMIPAADRARAGIGDGMIRLSVGLEPVEQLEADLLQALI
ncbi:MAG: trans-sulfuration enzyme family protein [Planctomycetota bacterium]|jgi:cystathionine beta-lyase/cystathionine gamma-synthase